MFMSLTNFGRFLAIFSSNALLSSGTPVIPVGLLVGVL